MTKFLLVGEIDPRGPCSLLLDYYIKCLCLEFFYSSEIWDEIQALFCDLSSSRGLSPYLTTILFDKGIQRLKARMSYLWRVIRFLLYDGLVSNKIILSWNKETFFIDSCSFSCCSHSKMYFWCCKWYSNTRKPRSVYKLWENRWLVFLY